MFMLSQETIVIITVDLALGTLMVTTTGDLRTEARPDREAFQNEMQALRPKAHAAREAVRSESRADREMREPVVVAVMGSGGQKQQVVAMFREPFGELVRKRLECGVNHARSMRSGVPLSISAGPPVRRPARRSLRRRAWA